MRFSVDDPWGDPVNLGPQVNSSANDGYPSISADGLSLFFGSFRAEGHGQADLWVTTRPGANGAWGAPVNLGLSLNTPGSEGAPSISSDGLMLFFSSFRTEGAGLFDIWMTRRATKETDWGVPVNLGPSINKQHSEYCVNVSADGSTLYFSSYRPGCGGIDLWQVPVLPPSQDGQEDRRYDTVPRPPRRRNGKEGDHEG